MNIFELTSEEMLQEYVKQFKPKQLENYQKLLEEAEQVIDGLIEYWKEHEQSEQAKQIAKERYLWDGEDWEKLSRRVAISIVAGYAPYVRKHKTKQIKEFLMLVYRLYYKLVRYRLALPNTPTLVNSGVGVNKELLYSEPTVDNIFDIVQKVYQQLDRKYQFAACNVLAIDDSMEGIMETLTKAALISKAGGGIGLNFGRLRYKDAPLSNGGTSSGSISFLELFDKMLATIKQGGKTRRGAGMATHGFGNLNHSEFWKEEFTIHPDAVDFISAKRDNDGESKLSNFNISVVINNTQDFLDKLEKNAPVKAVFDGRVVKENAITAKDYFHMLAKHAWKTGDPGIVFLDKINEKNPLSHILPIESTNVCGEQPLISSFKHKLIGSCNLISIDLFKVVKFSLDKMIPLYDILKALTIVAYDFLDTQLDLLMFPLEDQRRSAMLMRNVGVGYTALAGASATWGMELGSYNAFTGIDTKGSLSDVMAQLAERTGKILEEVSRTTSTAKAQVFGRYLLFEQAKYDDELIAERNVAVTTIQPSGTVGILMQTEKFGDVGQGIEPYYSLYYIRRYRENNTQEWKTLEYCNKLLAYYLDDVNILEEIKKHKGQSKAIKDPEIAKWFKTALEMDWKEHLKVLSAASKYISSAVSKTVNLPKNATVETVEQVFLEAAKDPYIKDITIYRDGSLSTQVLKSEKKETKPVFNINKKGHLLPKERPAFINSIKKELRFRVNGEVKKVYVEVGFDEKNEPFEVFFRATESTKEYAPFFNLAGRMVSLALRSNIEREVIIKQLRKTKTWRNEYDPVANILADAVMEIIDYVNARGKKKQRLKELEELKKHWVMTPKGYYIDEEGNPRCPVCGEILTIESGCAACKACGYSACTGA